VPEARLAERGVRLAQQRSLIESVGSGTLRQAASSGPWMHFSCSIRGSLRVCKHDGATSEQRSSVGCNMECMMMTLFPNCPQQ
jgi:hypothetical protein